MADLTSGRLLPCLDSKAGVDTIYLGKWVRDSGVIDLENEITFSQPIDFYEYQARDIQVSETLQHSDEGEIYQFSINVDLQGIDKETSKELNVLCDLLLLAIVQFENGNQKVYGFSSGLDVGLTETSGGAKSSFSGYNLTLKGEDEKIPYFGGVLPIEYPFFLDANGVTIKLKQGFQVGATGLADGDTSGKVYTAVDNTTLFAMNPATDDYTSVCTTLCTDMSNLFEFTSFNQDVSHWDISNVNSLFRIFKDTNNFNQDLSNWDVSNVVNFQGVFSNASAFNKPLNSWDVSNGVNLGGVFFGTCVYNLPLNNWNTQNATSMKAMFDENTVFNQDIGMWNVSSVQDFFQIFQGSVFNQDIGMWNVSNATNMGEMFRNNSVFNQDLSTWCVEQIPTEPTNFATGATAWVLPKPNWGDPC